MDDPRLKIASLRIDAMRTAFDESKHPRDNAGRFSEKEGDGSGGKSKKRKVTERFNPDKMSSDEFFDSLNEEEKIELLVENNIMTRTSAEEAASDGILDSENIGESVMADLSVAITPDPESDLSGEPDAGPDEGAQERAERRRENSKVSTHEGTIANSKKAIDKLETRLEQLDPNNTVDRAEIREIKSKIGDHEGRIKNAQSAIDRIQGRAKKNPKIINEHRENPLPDNVIETYNSAEEAKAAGAKNPVIDEETGLYYKSNGHWQAAHGAGDTDPIMVQTFATREDAVADMKKRGFRDDEINPVVDEDTGLYFTSNTSWMNVHGGMNDKIVLLKPKKKKREARFGSTGRMLTGSYVDSFQTASGDRYVTYFLLNGTENLKGWGVTNDSIPRHIATFRNMPFVITSRKFFPSSPYGDVYDHPSTEHFAKLGISREGRNDMEKQARFQEEFRVGNIEEVFQKGGDWFAFIRILPQFANMEMPPLVSPALFQLNPAEPANRITTWLGMHLAGLDEKPAYHNYALYKGSCYGDKGTCLRQLSAKNQDFMSYSKATPCQRMKKAKASLALAKLHIAAMMSSDHTNIRRLNVHKKRDR